MNRPIPSPASQPRGFTLTEIVIALGLFIFAMTAIMGLLPFGMNQVQAASNENTAMTDMESIRDDVALALSTRMATSLRYGIATPSATAATEIDLLMSENGMPAEKGTAIFRITGTLRRGSANQSEPTHLHLRTTWPARALPGKESGSVELVAAFAP